TAKVRTMQPPSPTVIQAIRHSAGASRPTATPMKAAAIHTPTTAPMVLRGARSDIGCSSIGSIIAHPAPRRTRAAETRLYHGRARARPDPGRTAFGTDPRLELRCGGRLRPARARTAQPPGDRDPRRAGGAGERADRGRRPRRRAPGSA